MGTKKMAELSIRQLMDVRHIKYGLPFISDGEVCMIRLVGKEEQLSIKKEDEIYISANKEEIMSILLGEIERMDGLEYPVDGEMVYIVESFNTVRTMYWNSENPNLKEKFDLGLVFIDEGGAKSKLSEILRWLKESRISQEYGCYNGHYNRIGVWDMK